MRHLAILLILLLVPSSVLAANRTVKVRGVIGLCGTSQCSIGELNPGYLFIPRTKIASQILNVCGEGDDCEIAGVVDKQDYFVSVSSVRLVDTNIEPSKDVIFRAAEWLFEIRDDDSINGVYIRYVDMVRLQKIIKKARPVWFAKIVVYGYKDKQPITIGPGDVFLVRRQGEWHFYGPSGFSVGN